MEKRIMVSIRRFNPAEGTESKWEQYEIPSVISAGMTIVDALKYIRENIDPSLAFYYSCELAKCRGCVIEVNGKATFACTEPVANGQKLEPLSFLPVIRDLVVKFIDSNIEIDQELCTGCGLCVDECPMDIYELSEQKNVSVVKDGTKVGFCGRADAVDCIGCRRCEEACPTGAIKIKPIGM